jgi:hypothetical protein
LIGPKRGRFITGIYNIPAQILLILQSC